MGKGKGGKGGKPRRGKGRRYVAQQRRASGCPPHATKRAEKAPGVWALWCTKCQSWVKLRRRTGEEMR